MLSNALGYPESLNDCDFYRLLRTHGAGKAAILGSRSLLSCFRILDMNMIDIAFNSSMKLPLITLDEPIREPRCVFVEVTHRSH